MNTELYNKQVREIEELKKLLDENRARYQELQQATNETIGSLGNNLIKLKREYEELQSSKIAECMAKSIAGVNTQIKSLQERNHNLVVENDLLRRRTSKLAEEILVNQRKTANFPQAYRLVVREDGSASITRSLL